MKLVLVALSFVVVVSGLAGCAEREAPSPDRATTAIEGALVPGRDVSLVLLTTGPRVLPGGTTTATLKVKNTGSGTWKAGSVTLSYVGDAGFTGGSASIPGSVSPNQVVTVTATLGAPTQIGLYTLRWQAKDKAGTFGAPIVASIEVTCGDGVFCNGDERRVNGKCVAGPPPCDDGEGCTTDTCDETADTCWHQPVGDCDVCAIKNCNPNCKSRVCGDDGCGGSCGACTSGRSCVGGACITALQPGTCANPLPLVAAGGTLLGDHVLSGDTSDGIDETHPSCNTASTARDEVYSFTVTSPVGIDARMSGFDSVLSLRKASCLDPAATVACSDDAAPPGNFGSRVAALLDPGTYFLIADGYNGSHTGPYTITVHFADNCVPGCDGKYCGSDGCGGDCGYCGAGSACNALGRCIPSPCTPRCQGRDCGDDGCGGSCGTCTGGQLCASEMGKCRTYADCDHAKPVCKTPCSSTQYCGTDCECHRNVDPRPDLIVHRDRLAGEVVQQTQTFSPESCAVFEGCVGGTGPRKLLRFTVEAVNQGVAKLAVPDPKTRPDLFQFSPCHGHYHFKGFATYALLDLAGNVVVTGLKQAYCMEDSEQVLLGPNIACTPQSSCDDQSISAGWADVYGNDLDCQWIDVTNVAPGNYQLEVRLNPSRIFEEASFDNNAARVPVTVQ